MALGSSVQAGNKVCDEKNCHGKKYIDLGSYGVWKNFLVCYTMEKENNFPKLILIFRNISFKVDVIVLKSC